MGRIGERGRGGNVTARHVEAPWHRVPGQLNGRGQAGLGVILDGADLRHIERHRVGTPGHIGLGIVVTPRALVGAQAAGEFPDADDPILSACAEHQRSMRKFIRDLAKEAGASDPDALADELMVLEEGAIGRAHIMGKSDIAKHAKRAAIKLIDHALAN